MVVVAAVATYCSAQAPGDEDADCTGAENAPTYPDTVKNLKDSYNYICICSSYLAMALETLPYRMQSGMIGALMEMMLLVL